MVLRYEARRCLLESKSNGPQDRSNSAAVTPRVPEIPSPETLSISHVENKPTQSRVHGVGEDIESYFLPHRDGTEKVSGAAESK